jgi:tetratricopeptide (TPR) repeat protein
MTDSQDPENNDATGEESLCYNLETLEKYLETAEQAAADQRLAESVAILREAVRRHPDRALAHYNLGVAIFMMLEADLSHLEIWENLAEQEELAEECVVAFQTAIERDPGMSAAYTNLASLLVLRGRTPEAVEFWEKSLELDPEQPEVRQNLEIYNPPQEAEESGDEPGA